jgi:hypothetical protein
MEKKKMKNIIKTIKFLGIGIVSTSFLTGCATISSNYTPYGLDADSSKNKVIESQEVILKTPEDFKIYSDAQTNVFKRILNQDIQKAYINLGDQNGEQLKDFNGNLVFDSEGKPVMIKKRTNWIMSNARTDQYGRIIENRNGIKAQSFKLFKTNNEFVFSGEQQRKSFLSKQIMGGNAIGNKRYEEFETTDRYVIKYSLKPILKTEKGITTVKSLTKTIFSECSYKDQEGEKRKKSCNDIRYFQDFMEFTKKINNSLEKDFSSEMKKEIAKTNLKTK